MNAIHLYRIGRWFYLHRLGLLSRVIYGLIFLLYNSSIPLSVEIGAGTRFAYGGMGVVIHGRCRIGENVTIGQQVTLGGRNRLHGVPVVESGCYIAAGSRILGPITIGAGSIVGANAVVISDVPPGCIVAGVPARIIREHILVDDYV